MLKKKKSNLIRNFNFVVKQIIRNEKFLNKIMKDLNCEKS
jgi:hypothetical protein